MGMHDRDGPAFQKEGLMAWIYLVSAGLLEIVWAWALKESAGFTKPVPALVSLVTLVASLGLLATAMKSLPLGTAYMVWTGIGAVGAFTVGVFVLNEHISALRVAAATLIVCGLVLMRLSENA
jgi:quaternary ammonium compound-resistance protein SugE